MTLAVLVFAAIALPLFTMLIVSADARAWLRGTGSIRQTLSNTGVGVVFLVTQLFLRGALIGAFAFVASLVPWKIPDDSALSALLAFVALDFVYYVQHRAEHAIPLLWAIHAVHHQSHDYNLSVSFRVGALASLSTFCFHALLALAGVSVKLYAAVVTVHALLLFGLHARTKFTLGPGRFFNAPVFHRVHHGADAACIDKNFGGVLLVFDRLFSTFAPYDREPTFGVAGDTRHLGPISANVAPWRELVTRVRRERTWTGKLRVMLKPRR